MNLIEEAIKASNLKLITHDIVLLCYIDTLYLYFRLIVLYVY